MATAAGYLTSYTETDPVFDASAAAAIGQVDLDAWDEAFAWGDHADAGYATEEALQDCPLGYVLDPSETGITVCYDPVTALANPNQADEVVKVGDFWIDRYEAQLRTNPDCSGPPFTASNLPVGFPADGNWTTPVYACSRPGDGPTGGLTWFQAEQACALRGKRLCSNEEWQTAVAGTWDPGQYGGLGGGPCNTQDGGPRGTGNAGSTPGGTDSCISNYGAEDMIGNLEEWTADWYAAGMCGWMTGDAQSATPWPAGYGDGGDRTWNLDGRAFSPATGWTDALPAAASRGGGWGGGTDAGAIGMNLNNGPPSSPPDIGFRCCID